jgi:sulfocyanin SoxE-like protein
MNRSEFLLLSLGGFCWALSGAAQTGASTSPTYDAATNTVTFALQAGAPPAPGASGSFNFNGYSNGGATLVVPPSSKIVMNFVNLDGVPHSAMIIPDADPMPAVGGDPALPRAYTKDVTQGLPQGGTDIMSFKAPATGSFRIFCGVPGHGQSGMWIRFKVDPKARTPSWVTS